MSLLIYFSFFFLAFWRFGSALPGHVERRDCESVACIPLPSPEEAIDGVLGTGAAVFGLAGEAWDFLTSPEPSEAETSATPVIPAQESTNSDDAQQSAEPTADIELDVIATPDPQLTTHEECNSLPLPNGNTGSDPTDSVTSSCEIATAQIVFLSICDDLAQIGVIQKMLEEMELSNEKTDGVFVSIDPMCATDGGAEFLVADLNPTQIKTMKETTGVRAVEPDAPVNRDDLTDEDQTEEDDTGPSPAANRLKKRDDVVAEAGAYTHLRFLSTPGGRDRNQVSDNYAYFSSAGEGVTVYVDEPGLNPQHEEFAGTKIDWLFPLKGNKRKADLRFDSHGTCTCSLIGGRHSGVSKKVDLVLIKTDDFISSSLDGLSLVIKDLFAKRDKGETVLGYTVLSMSLVFGYPGPETLGLYRKRLSTLMTMFNVVVVVCAGNDPSKKFGNIFKWPAKFASKLDIIVVGSVAPEPEPDRGVLFGQRYDFSRGGPGLTVNAPGKVVCGQNRVIRKPFGVSYGTSTSTAIVSGLIAGFLASPAGDWLREQPNFPLAVKNYVIGKSQFKRGNQKISEWSVTNGLNADNPGENGLHGWTL